MADPRLVRAGDHLRDRLQDLLSGGAEIGNQGEAVLEADRRGGAEEEIVVALEEVAQPDVLVAVELRSDPVIVGPEVGERRPDLADGVDEFTPPGCADRGPGRRWGG